MTLAVTNTYRLSCQVVEVIYKDEKRIIKAICNPGSLIIETPDAGLAQLGDRLLVTATLHIDTIKTDNNTKNQKHH